MSTPDPIVRIEELQAANRRWKTVAACLGCLCLVLGLLLLLAGGFVLTLSAQVQYYRELSGAH